MKFKIAKKKFKLTTNKLNCFPFLGGKYKIGKYQKKKVDPYILEPKEKTQINLETLYILKILKGNDFEDLGGTM